MTYTWPKQSQCLAFYGDTASPGWAEKNLVRVKCPWTIRMGTQTVPSIEIHRLCAPALEEILADIYAKCGKSQPIIEAHHYDRYSGSYNPRDMRLVKAPSMHSYGAAIDWDAPENPEGKLGLFKPTDILPKAFTDRGCVWGGTWKGKWIDGMHVQFAIVD